MEVNISHNLTRKASVGMYYTYVLITPTTLVCLLLALPSLLNFSLSNYFLYLLTITTKLNNFLHLEALQHAI